MAKKITTIRRKRGAVAEAKAVAAKLTPRDKKTMGSIVGLADRVVDAAGVVPVDPAGGLSLELGGAAPTAGPVVVDELALVEPDGRFHQRVVQGVADRPDRPGDPRLGELLGERQRGIL